MKGDSAIGNRFRGVRNTLLNLTLADMSIDLGITGSVLGKVERGDGNLDFKKLQILIEKYHLSLNYLIGGIGEPLIETEKNYRIPSEKPSIVNDNEQKYETNDIAFLKLKLEGATKELELYKKLYEKSEAELALLKYKKQ